jgi:translin
MIDKKAFAEMRGEIEKFDLCREQIIKKSRDVLKASKAAIYEIHRGHLDGAQLMLDSAKKNIKEIEKTIEKDKHLAAVGAYSEALEEYVEASCYYGFIKDKKLLTAKQLGVDTDVYLPGLCDLVGELVRKAINSVINGNKETALEIKDFVAEVYEELMTFDFRNIPVRKKFDSIKYGLEKLEDLALQLKLKDK